MAQDREVIKKLMEGQNLEELKQVRDYLREHPLANIIEINAATRVSPSKILTFIQLGIFKMRKPRRK